MFEGYSFVSRLRILYRGSLNYRKELFWKIVIVVPLKLNGLKEMYLYETEIDGIRIKYLKKSKEEHKTQRNWRQIFSPISNNLFRKDSKNTMSLL